MGFGIKIRDVRTVGIQITYAPLWGVVFAVLVSCSSEPPRPAFDPLLADRIDHMATTAAVAKTGAKVCRQTSIGIAERDWLRGVVTEVTGDAIAVRIEDPGRFPQSVNGVPVARGAVLRDSAMTWTPCRF